MTFVQRFGDALNLNVHFHMLALDGVYAEDADGFVRFHPVSPPTDAEVERVAARIARRVEKLMRRHGFPNAFGAMDDGGENDPAVQPFLAELYGAAVSGRALAGARAGMRTAWQGDAADANAALVRKPRRCASVVGVDVHSDTSIPAHDRMRLERMCRYMCRPPIALERLAQRPDGRLVCRLKRPWRDGTNRVVFEPMELMERLSALVPAPRFNLVRYSGVLAPSAAWRDFLVPRIAEPTPESEASADDTTGATGEGVGGKGSGCEGGTHGRHPRRYSWAELLKRVFAVDVLRCGGCGGRMRILCAVNPPEAIRKILAHLGLPARPPPISPASLQSSDCC